MLRRFLARIAALFSSDRGELQRLDRLIRLLRSHGVSHYRTDKLRLELAPLKEQQAESRTGPGPRPPTDDELLFGEPEAVLRRQGLVG